MEILARSLGLMTTVEIIRRQGFLAWRHRPALPQHHFTPLPARQTCAPSLDRPTETPALDAIDFRVTMKAASRGPFSPGAANPRGGGELSTNRRDIGGISCDDDHSPPPYKDERPPFQRLPDGVVLRIPSRLGLISRASLKYTNSHLRKLIPRAISQSPQCNRWRVLCLLEQDYLAKNVALNRLTCCFCKRSHPKEDFGVRGRDTGCGVECLYMLGRYSPEVRYCYRHVPKTVDYSSTTEDGDTITKVW